MLLTSSFKFTILCAAIFTLVPASARPLNDEEPDRQVLLGYRRVSPEQAKRYSDAKTITDDPNNGGSQIGTGVYLTPERDGYLPDRGMWLDSWYCVAHCSEKALRRVGKALIPRTWGMAFMYQEPDVEIDKFIKTLNPAWDPRKTIRIAYHNTEENSHQKIIAVPHALLNSRGGGMDISVVCKQKWEDLPEEVVDFSDKNWGDNKEGNLWNIDKEDNEWEEDEDEED